MMWKIVTFGKQKTKNRKINLYHYQKNFLQFSHFHHFHIFTFSHFHTFTLSPLSHFHIFTTFTFSHFHHFHQNLQIVKTVKMSDLFCFLVLKSKIPDPFNTSFLPTRAGVPNFTVYFSLFTIHHSLSAKAGISFLLSKAFTC